VVEDLIRRLLDVKKHKVTGKKVGLSEPEIRQRSRGGGPDTVGVGREEAQGDGEEGATQRAGDPAALRRHQGGLALPVQPPRF
jgi:hypothetical protein